MEAIGASANVLAFVLLGLKCAKTIHNTLSIVKDGPPTVQRLANTILHLHWTLEQIKQSRAAADDVSLRGQIQNCVQHLSSLAAVIEKLQIYPNERTTGRIWRRLRLVMDEKTLNMIDGQVTQQAAMLSLRLNVLSSNILYESREEGILFGRRMEQLDASIQTQRQCHTIGLSQLEASLSSNLLSHNSDMQEKLSSLQQAIEARASISAQDTNSMHTILQEIRDRVISPREAVPFQPIPENTEGNGSHIYPQDSGTCSDNSGPENEMIDCINQLSCLIDEKSRSIDTYADDDEQATCIIENMQSLLRTAQKRHDAICQMEEKAREDDIRRITKRLFDGQLSRFSRSFGHNELSINQGVTRKLEHLPNGVLEQTREYKETDIGIGTLGLIMHKRIRSNAVHDADDEHPRPQRRGYVDYEMTVTFIPKNNQRFHMFIASALQRELFEGVASVSRLMVNRVLPAGSLVFELVREGKLQELQEMLKNGDASLRDHDEYGASLLSYSMQQPEMCKFLVDSGIDVDHAAYDNGVRNWDENGSFLTPLQIHNDPVFRNEIIDEPSYIRINKCRRLLLEAGADPTIELDQFCFLKSVAFNGTPGSLRLGWSSDTTRYFADIRKYGHQNGRSLFLQYCINQSFGYTAGMLKEFLDLGADIQDRDEDGSTCLHLCLVGAGHPRCIGKQEFEAFRYLVESGADVFAVDYQGRAVSDVAYSESSIYPDIGIGGYVGDLWDSVLQSCGFDIAQFRSGYKRTARYSANYTRQIFEQLWQGREAHCPYWDDLPWTPEEAVEEDRDDPQIEREEASESNGILDAEGDDTEGDEDGSDKQDDANYLGNSRDDVLFGGSPASWSDNLAGDPLGYGLGQQRHDDATLAIFQLPDIDLENPWE
ncbi:hypothetical protein F5X99DRAFT_387019 [Biscogniauxia marginata]|nr:hypothetical protein F5X99DRAFT_387019 [Biscogniauxia marginata]